MCGGERHLLYRCPASSKADGRKAPGLRERQEAKEGGGGETHARYSAPLPARAGLANLPTQEAGPKEAATAGGKGGLAHLGRRLDCGQKVRRGGRAKEGGVVVAPFETFTATSAKGRLFSSAEVKEVAC